MFKKFMKALRRMHKDDRGMTGLETAIILIAFVTVAAVFGYAVLSAGLFSAERGKETIYSGLQQAKSNLELAGSVVATSTDNTTVKTILVTVRNAIAGEPIDLTPCTGNSTSTNVCVISLSTKDDYLNDIKWSATPIGNADNDNLLEVGEQFELTIDTTSLGSGKTLTNTLSANEVFNIQIKPNLGSTITIQRTLPAQIDKVMDLH